MKICFLSNAQNYHTIKWATWFSSHGHEVSVISFVDAKISGVRVYYVGNSANPEGSDANKIAYLTHRKKIKEYIEQINPDIINAHYATSYGTAMALTGIHPYILSVWGSDIYDFPNHGFLQKLTLKYSLKKADYLFSTSKAMASEGGKYTKKHFEITPFGVDMDLFSPAKRTRHDDKFVIGTVKSLSPKYGIDTLLKAAALVYKEHPEYNLEVRIAGKGPAEKELKVLAKQLGIDNIVCWLGFISQEDAAREWANMDIGVVSSSSSSESFGVSAVECQACGIPVIITDIPGLKEATKPGKTSVVIPRKDYYALAEEFIRLYNDPKLRALMGKEGRTFVFKEYELNNCFEKVEKLFSSIQK